MTTALKIRLSGELETAYASAIERMTALREELLTLDTRGDSGDLNRTTAERRSLVANIVQTHEQMEQIGDARQRLREGAYGLCCECDEPVGERRLLVQPWSRRCLPCQERWESVTPEPFRGWALNTTASLQEGA
jgi:RNA polymerase-binding transcription factor DksA